MHELIEIVPFWLIVMVVELSVTYKIVSTARNSK